MIFENTYRNLDNTSNPTKLNRIFKDIYKYIRWLYNNNIPSTRNINTTYPLMGGGDLTVDRTFYITQSSPSDSGFISSTNYNDWYTAYNNTIASASVTGTTTKTLTLNQQDGGTITASWTDVDAAPVTSVFGRIGAITAQSGDYTTTLVTEGTNLYFTNARAIASTLTGYISGAGTITSSDTILTAIQKLNGNTNALSSVYFPLIGGTITGTGGNGFIGLPSQNTVPTTPLSGFRLYANSSHALSWIGQNGFTRTFDGTSNTANRTYTLPNFDGNFLLTSTTPSSGSVLFGTGTTIGQDNTNFFWDNINKKLEVFKLYTGNADYYFENDPYTTSINSLKIGGVAHQYGISVNQTNGGMDWTFFKESGDASGNRTPIIADRRVLPNQEIAYHQYSAHNGVDDIYGKKSIAVITRASPSSNSTLGNMKGTYTIVTANNNGFDVSPLNIDVFISEQKIAFNAPVNITTNDLTKTVNIFGDLVSSTGLFSNKLELSTGGVVYNQYINGEWRLKKGSSSFDLLKVNEDIRPLIIQGGSAHLPFYIYTDTGGAGFTTSASVLSGLYMGTTVGSFLVNNNEIFRFDVTAGSRLGVNTGSGNNATFDVRGSTSSTRAFLVKDNNSVELLRVNNGGNVIINPTSSNTLIGSTIDVGLGKLQVTGNCYVSGTLRIGTITITTGTGSPEGVVTATVGSQFMRTDGGANTTLYVKESGTGNTGWVAK